MRKRIALVEDEPSHAILIRYNLEQRGYQIDHYSSGNNFFKKIHSNPGLIIISVQLSDVDGLKLCEEIRKKGIATPILFLTTSLKDESCSCIDNVDYLRKPFSIPDLIQKVQRVF
ncbi:response regulator transcription factor [Paenibacillus barengoltzii]|uniref:response regulator transcription factor n=1 Tax=Paenibacillus barengoltzii TaxID=343517 RepID=UPI003F8AF959